MVSEDKKQLPHDDNLLLRVLMSIDADMYHDRLCDSCANEYNVAPVISFHNGPWSSTEREGK